MFIKRVLLAVFAFVLVAGIDARKDPQPKASSVKINCIDLLDKSSSVTPTCKKVASLFDEWNAALSTLKPSEVAAKYAPFGVLLPTVSNKVRTSKELITDYFKTFLTYKPAGVINESNVRVLSNNSAIHSGVYTFTLTKDGKPSQVTARFSYTYVKIGSKWYIADHHSSAMPEKK